MSVQSSDTLQRELSCPTPLMGNLDTDMAGGEKIVWSKGDTNSNTNQHKTPKQETLPTTTTSLPAAASASSPTHLDSKRRYSGRRKSSISSVPSSQRLPPSKSPKLTRSGLVQAAAQSPLSNDAAVTTSSPDQSPQAVDHTHSDNNSMGSQQELQSWTLHAEAELNNLLLQPSGSNVNPLGGGCLDVSLSILNASMEQAKMGYEALGFQEDQGTTDESRSTLRNTPHQTSSPSSWWMNIVQKLQASHEAERHKWKNDLRAAKMQDKHQLKSSIEQRIQLLEDKFIWDYQSQQNGGMSVPDTIPSSSTAASNATASTLENYTGTADDQLRRDPIYNALLAANTGEEVPFDTAQAVQRLHELEQRVQDHEFEKDEWDRALKHAEYELLKDKKLSAAMQQQLHRLAKEIDIYSDTSHKQCKQKQEDQKQLIALLEQQLSSERYEWLNEKERLEHTVQQLTADTAGFKMELLNNAEKIKRMAREEKKLRTEKEKWAYEKNLLESTISQLTADKLASKSTAIKLQRALDKLSDEGLDITMVYTEADETLDRALAERDMYKQEAENLKIVLEKERTQFLEAKANSEETVREIRDEFGAIVDELKKQLKTRTQIDPPRVNTNKRAEQKQVTDEHTQVLDKLEKRLDETVFEKELQESRAKNMELTAKLKAVERQHISEKGEWKLSLESALADARKAQDIKEALEVEIRELKQGLGVDDNKESPLAKELEDVQAECQRLHNELTQLRANYESEVQDLLARAAARPAPGSKGEWKLQLESALADSRRMRGLKEALEQKVRELKVTYEQSANFNHPNDITSLETACESLIKENHRLHAQIDELHRQVQHQHEQFIDLKEQYDRESRVWAAQLDEARLHEKAEIEELTQKYAQEINPSREREQRQNVDLNKLKTKYESEIKELKQKMASTQQPDPKLVDKVQRLTEELGNIRVQHLQAQMKWESQLQIMKNEKDSRIHDLETRNMLAKEHQSSTEKVIAAVSKRIDNLHQDVLSVKENTLAASKNHPTFDKYTIVELKTSVDQMQNSLDDTIAELTLEADAVMEIKSLVESFSTKMMESNDNRRFMKQQEALLSEMKGLRAHLNGVVDHEHSATVTQSMYKDIVAELQRKVARIAELEVEVVQLRNELDENTEKLKHAEAEIATLSEHADAYNDEIMRMQSANMEMEESLRLTEGLQDPEEYGNHKSYDDSTPMLEEALALAQGLQDLVQGREGDENILDMLQSLSDLMDHQEQREEAISRSLSLEGSVGDEVPAPIQESSRSQPRTPQRRQLIEALHPRPKIYKQNRDSPPPEPISTPENSQQTSDTNSSLQQVVEQLYGRCQILERERTEMMAVTLDLLESARKANTAELEAALATVRRQAMEDVLRVRQQNTVDQERLYQKLCTDNGFSKATAPTHEPVLDVMSKSVLMVYNE